MKPARLAERAREVFSGRTGAIAAPARDNTQKTVMYLGPRGRRAGVTCRAR